MADAPDIAVRARLAAQVASLTVGTNLFAGPMRAPGAGVPATAVFCRPQAGLVNRPYLGTGTDWKVHQVGVLVRAEQDRFEVGIALAREVHAALHRAELPGYTYCLVDQPAPEYLGADETGCHLWVVNPRLGIKE